MRDHIHTFTPKNMSTVEATMKRIIREAAKNKERFFLDAEWCAHEQVVALYCKVMAKETDWIAFRVKTAKDIRVHVENLCLALRYVYIHTDARGIVIMIEEEEELFASEDAVVLSHTWSVSRAQIMNNKYAKLLPNTSVRQVQAISRADLLVSGENQNRMNIEFRAPEPGPGSESDAGLVAGEASGAGVSGYTGGELRPAHDRGVDEPVHIVDIAPPAATHTESRGRRYKLRRMSGRYERDFEHPDLPIGDDSTPYETLILVDNAGVKFHYEVEVFTHPEPDLMLNKTFADYSYVFVDPRRYIGEAGTSGGGEAVDLSLDAMVRSAIQFARNDDTIDDLTQAEKESFEYMYSIDELILRIIHMIMRHYTMDDVETIQEFKKAMAEMLGFWALYTVYDHDYIRQMRAEEIPNAGMSRLDLIRRALRDVFLQAQMVVSAPDDFPIRKTNLVDHIYDTLKVSKEIYESSIIPFSVTRRVVETAKVIFLEYHAKAIAPQVAAAAIEAEPLEAIMSAVETLLANEHTAIFENAQNNLFQLSAYFRQFVEDSVNMRVRHAVEKAMNGMNQRQLCANAEPRLLDIIMSTRAVSSTETLKTHARAAINAIIRKYTTVESASASEHAVLKNRLAEMNRFVVDERMFGPFGDDGEFGFTDPAEGVDTDVFADEQFMYVSPVIGRSNALTDARMLDCMFYRMLRTMKERVNIRMSMISEKDTLRIPFNFNSKDRYLGTPSSYHDPFMVMLRERMYNAAIMIMKKWPTADSDHGKFARVLWSEIAVSDLDEISEKGDIVYVQRMVNRDFSNSQFGEEPIPPEDQAPPGYEIKRFGFVLNMSSFEFRDTRDLTNQPDLIETTLPTIAPWHFVMYPVQDYATKTMYTVKRLSSMDEFRNRRFPGIAYMHMAMEVLVRKDRSALYPREDARIAHIKRNMTLNLLMPNVLWKTHVDGVVDGSSKDYMGAALYFNQGLEKRRYSFAIFCDLFNPNLLDIFSVYHVREYTAATKKTPNGLPRIIPIASPYSFMHYSVRDRKVEYMDKGPGSRSPVIVALMNVVLGKQAPSQRQILCHEQSQPSDENGDAVKRVVPMSLAEQRGKVEELFKDAVFMRTPEIKLLHPMFPRAARYDPRVYVPTNNELVFTYTPYYIRIHDWSRFK